MADPTLDTTRIEAGLKALREAPEHARTLVMKWAVATVALQDLIRAKGNIEAPWPEVAVIAATWLEESGRGGRRSSEPGSSG
jgi:hypothetical protein